MRVLSSIIIAAAFAFAAATPSVAEEYRDEEGNFHLTVPDSWMAKKLDNPMLRVFMVSPRVQETLGACLVIVQPHPELRELKQDEIDAKLGAAIDAKFWEFVLTLSPGIENPELKSSNTETKHGRNAYSAVMSFTLSVTPKGKEPIKIPSTAKQMMVAIPGQFYFVTCNARTEGYASEETDFNIVFDSFEPNTDALTVSNETPGVPSLTLYSQSRFGGVSRVFMRDTPDLAASGWRDSASASTGGGDSWELCDRADYAGSCRLVSGAQLSGLGHVASARRVPASLSRLAASGAADALAASAQTERRR